MAASATVAMPRRAPSGARRLLRRLLFLTLAAAVLGAGYMLWLRDSSLVAVKTVRVEGLRERGDEELRAALAAAAREMTTLHVRTEDLAAAARGFPLAAQVSADAGFPSTLTVTVRRRRPAALIGSGAGAVAVAGDGVVLRGLPAAELDLPALPLAAPPEKARLGGTVLEQARVLGAAPAQIRPFLEESLQGQTGVSVLLEGGVELRFGGAERAADKWAAATAVLSDPQLGALDYVDLRSPGRPAVGGISHYPPPLAG